MKINKVRILILIFIVGFYFRTDILKLYPATIQEISKVEKTGISNLDKIRGDVGAIINRETHIFTPPPIKASVEVLNSSLTFDGTIAETNNQRVKNNLMPLKENIKLNEMAKVKVLDMFDNQYFEHASPSGQGPADLAKIMGYDYLIIGENLALGNFENDEKLIEAWMASSEHRENILNDKYTEIGVAAEKGIYEGKSVWMAVQEFGRPESVYSKISQDIKTKAEEISKIIEVKKAELENTGAITKNISEYNDKVNAYNDLIQQYNNLVSETKDTVDGYDDKVRAYKECLK